jgi:hypothetical protein
MRAIPACLATSRICGRGKAEEEEVAKAVPLEVQVQEAQAQDLQVQEVRDHHQVQVAKADQVLGMPSLWLSTHLYLLTFPSSTGGATKQGSGVQPSYGGGKYYGGGAKTPYSSGGVSPRGIAPVFLGGAALAVFPGLWFYGAYAYPYHNPYTFRNRTGRRNNTQTRRDTDSVQLIDIRQDDTGVNQTKTVQCLCALYSECGCDDEEDPSFLDSLIGDGTYASLNHSLVDVVDFANGTSQIVLNGTLPNGTTVAGGTEDAFDSSARWLQASGYSMMIALVGCTVFLV